MLLINVDWPFFPVFTQSEAEEVGIKQSENSSDGGI